MCYNHKLYLMLLLYCCLMLPLTSLSQLARDPFHSAEDEPAVMASVQQPAEEQQLITRVISPHYANAAMLEKTLKANPSLFSEQGTISTDLRSNRLIIHDTRQRLGDIISVLNQLDIPTQEVSIQARIMNMDRQFERSIGLRFGVTKANHLSGTLQGANQIASNALQAVAKPVANVPLNQRLNFDFPASIDGVAQAPSIGIALAKLGKGVLLDMELSAVEAEGGGKLLSAPHLITANMVPAYIEAGEEIPYEESTSEGATAASFKKAVLALRVVPQILADKHIVLDIKVNQDKRGSELIKGEPAIDTRQIATKVVVANGQTVVLGGIFEQGNRDGVVRIPFISSIPIIGALFSSRYQQSDQEELLVFITPRIINNDVA